MTYVLLPGAGGEAWYWHRVEEALTARGHDVVNVDLPADDEDAGLPEYVQITADLVGGRTDLTVVALSMGGFLAPLLCAHLPVMRLVMVNAMIPNPGEAPGEWWDNTGAPAARRAADLRDGRDPDAEFDASDCFLHDVPADLAAESLEHNRNETEAAFSSRCEFARWPDVPTRVLAGTDDRFFPFEFQRRVAADRLGVEIEPVPGGHLAPLSRPEELVAALLRQ